MDIRTKAITLHKIKELHEAANPDSLFFKGEVLNFKNGIFENFLRLEDTETLIAENGKLCRLKFFQISTNRFSGEYFFFYPNRPEHIFDGWQSSQRRFLLSNFDLFPLQKIPLYPLIYKCNEDAAKIAGLEVKGFFKDYPREFDALKKRGAHNIPTLQPPPQGYKPQF